MIRVLLIEDDPEHADLIQSQITRKHGANVQIRWVRTLKEGIAGLEERNVDVALSDLGLPDSMVHETLARILPHAQAVPIVVLSSLEDEDLGIKSVHEGAQDYISKSWMDGELLFRSLRYAIERKRIEEELRSANRAKDEFLATLSHELRTPIGVIQGFAQILMQDDIPEEDKKHATEAILRNSEIQVLLVNDMLDMSKIITGALTLDSDALELQPIMRDAIESIQLAAKTKKIEVKTFFDDDAGPILGDKTRLQQIVWNLLSNSVKFTPLGGRIEIHLKRVGSQAEIVVTDTGVGIDPAFLPYVFDRFRQEDSSIRRQYGGLGLGLSIVKYLAELHGGAVHAASGGRGAGATFTVSFPLIVVRTGSPANEEPIHEKETSKTLSHQAVARVRLLEGLKILAIDDSKDSLTMLRHLLQRSGATVTTAASADEARTLLLSMKPDLIVSDIGMPIEDGMTFIRTLRAGEPDRHLPAIALTAYTRDEEKQEILQSGFQLHIGKPVNETALLGAIMDLRRSTNF